MSLAPCAGINHGVVTLSTCARDIVVLLYVSVCVSVMKLAATCMYIPCLYVENKMLLWHFRIVWILLKILHLMKVLVTFADIC